MTTFEGRVAVIAPNKGWGEKDNTELFRHAIGRPIEILLPTANGPVRGLARVLRTEGSHAVVEYTVDESRPISSPTSSGTTGGSPPSRCSGPRCRTSCSF